VRTTLTLDKDVAERLRQEMRRSARSMKACVNDALRRGLGLVGRPPKAPRFAVEPHAFGFKPGIDLDRISYTSFGLTLIGGLTTATLLTLLVVPVFYTFFDDAQLVTGRAIRHALGAEPRGERAEA
jgi:hypothetical protein